MFFFSYLSLTLAAQVTYTRQDSLRGSITKERAWWDLVYYHLAVEVLPDKKAIIGSNQITYQVLTPYQIMQIDLQDPMVITNVVQEGQELSFSSEGSAHFISLLKPQISGAVASILIYYEGEPRRAKNAPWDGGLSWKKDSNGIDFIATSCQGLGASIWWPNKDHMYDEVDSMLISVEVPNTLLDVSNGQLRRVDHNRLKGTSTYHWFVSNPINNYGVNINIGDYVNWSEKYLGDGGALDVNYWVLRENEAKARTHFSEVPRMLNAFEYWFGRYPFYVDGYKLVEVPYLGMEHQSSVTYGNHYENGYLGRDLSETGWGLKFDFIIIHESAHEWFANNIIFKDQADMWIHESFAAYSESLYIEYYYGKYAGFEYCQGTRDLIANQYPIIGSYQVNSSIKDSDAYYKGANLLNMIRQIVNDDELWRKTLVNLGSYFHHKTVNSQEIETFISEVVGLDLSNIFEQYLRNVQLAKLEYYQEGTDLFYRWDQVTDAFDMPIDVIINGVSVRLYPSGEWSSYEISESADMSVKFDLNYYIELSHL